MIIKNITYTLGLIVLLSCQEQKKQSMTEEQFRQHMETNDLQIRKEDSNESFVDSIKWNTIRREVKKANPNSSDAFIDYATNIQYQNHAKSLYDTEN